MESIQKITKYCSDILSHGKCPKLPFHNLVHTQEVVDKVLFLSEAIGVEPEDVENIAIAACFHDTGFSKVYGGHENVSKKIARDYLRKSNFPKKTIDTILGCIEATKMPQKPNGRLESILCDADLFHLGTSDFFYRTILLKKERELFCGLDMTDTTWQLTNLKFLEAHQFKTGYGRDVLEIGKQKNLNRIKQLFRYCEV